MTIDLGTFNFLVSDARGRFRELQARSQALADQHPVATEAVAELSNTLEELRVADEELHSQSDQLVRTSEEADRLRRRYQELFEFAPGAYLVTDPQGTIMEANKAAGTLFARLPYHLIGKPLAALVIVGERENFRARLNDAASATEVRVFDTAVRPSDETPPVAVEARVQAVQDRAGRPAAIRWLLLDVTEQRRLRLENRRLDEGMWQRVAERTGYLSRDNDTLRADLASLRAQLGLPPTSNPPSRADDTIPGRADEPQGPSARPPFSAPGTTPASRTG